ncbi:Gfo/Idh/MocA family protein [Paenibacillus sp. HJGM_3]|uniref:Gfo/Idh/MocA family protein n=1 Tax=Paenibacillus sp. HJGM_3 TaxID=3379816 RepID=UPI00385BBF19
MGDRGSQLRLGIIGLGRRMGVMLGALRRADPACTLTAVADPRQADIRLALGEQGVREGTRWYSRAEEMLAAEAGALDAILIGSRCSSHAALALQALPTGLPLFLEKPVATTLPDLLQLKAGADTYGGHRVLVSFPLRMTPMAALVKQLVDSGVIGTVEHVQAVTNIAYGSVYFKRWYRDEAETGGLFLQKATHDLDVINYLLGQQPVMVCAMGSKQIFRGTRPAGLRCEDCADRAACPDSELPGESCCYAVDTGNEDSGSLLIRYASGMHVSYSQNFFVRRAAGNRSIRLMGYKGTIEFEWESDTIKLMLHHSPVVETFTVGAAREPHFGGDRALAEHFVSMVRDEAASRASLQDGLISALLCLKAKQSSAENRFLPVEWA